MQKSYIVWCAPGAGLIELTQIRSELEKSRADRDYNAVAGWSVHWVEVPVGGVISVLPLGGLFAAQKQDVDSIKAELEKGKKDPNHIIVIPYNISWTEIPNSGSEGPVGVKDPM